MKCLSSLLIPTVAVLTAVAGAAGAQTVTRPTIDLSGPRAPIVLRSLQTSALEAAVMPRTAVSYSFGPRDVVGQAGFLCGREPGHTDSGSAAAFGSDPHGRFVGARLSRAF